MEEGKHGSGVGLKCGSNLVMLNISFIIYRYFSSKYLFTFQSADASTSKLFPGSIVQFLFAGLKGLVVVGLTIGNFIILVI